MGHSGLSEEVMQFISSNIESVAHLELLLFLRSRRGESLSSEAIVKALRSHLSFIDEQLKHLLERGLVTREKTPSGDAYSFSPSTPELARAVDSTAVAYAERRVAVIQRIYESPIDRLRGFADAFKFRKEP